MRFKIDENLSTAVAALFVANGHDAVTVVDEHLTGVTDPELATVVQSERRAIVTQDTDFLDIVAHPPSSYPGIIVLRLARPSRKATLTAIERLVIPALATTPLEKSLWVVDDAQIRTHG